ncbi:MAG: hypothetical protein CM1200mP41_13140 [Gammaproteobacteria bacterium]|nr:MAG: hypothetical protein CM1200mP41_13140 [Gammaproteobacteria bacterium]
MAETMYAAPGIGLAAPRATFINDSGMTHPKNETTSGFHQPDIDSGQGETETEEGCLSLPGSGLQ